MKRYKIGNAQLWNYKCGCFFIRWYFGRYFFISVNYNNHLSEFTLADGWDERGNHRDGEHKLKPLSSNKTQGEKANE